MKKPTGTDIVGLAVLLPFIIFLWIVVGSIVYDVFTGSI